LLLLLLLLLMLLLHTSAGTSGLGVGSRGVEREAPGLREYWSLPTCPLARGLVFLLPLLVALLLLLLPGRQGGCEVGEPRSRRRSRRR
jgi:hypothetical protein